jgi:hypothetical protein
LLQHTIAQARGFDAKSLFLGSNTRLKNAVHLYESVGFRHVKPESLPPMPYSRADLEPATTPLRITQRPTSNNTSYCSLGRISQGGRGLQGRGRGFDMGSITVPDRTLQRQKEPSVTLVFCKLRPSFSLSRQRSRVRAPSSPPYIPKHLRDVWT